jgi:hypothetical protein
MSGGEPGSADGEQAAFFGGLRKRIGRVVRRAAPILRKIARVAAPIAAAVGTTAVARALIRRRRGAAADGS